MCTAITYQTKDFYLGRTLDYEISYNEEIIITPRNYTFHFLEEDTLEKHYAMIGIATIKDNYPLYYEAVNEKGLGMIGLHFVGNAIYFSKQKNKRNIAPFELIPWILGKCKSVQDVKKELLQFNLLNKPFQSNIPLAELHWLVADQYSSIVIESRKDGLHVFDNPIGVLTNNPPFEQQVFALNNYMQLSVKEPKNYFNKNLPMIRYSRGMGALGLPGDFSSQSRFVRAAFIRSNSVCHAGEVESVNQFFHILQSVDVVRGCCEMGKGKYAITFYTSCCNTSKGIYYYTTYQNHQIHAVDMYKENLDGMQLIRFSMMKEEQIHWQNSK